MSATAQTAPVPELPIRLAQRSDEPELLRHIETMHREGGMRPLDLEKARETLALSFDRKGGMLAVIGPPGDIRAMLFLRIGNLWYSAHNHLEEVFNWVHPNHRRTNYATRLLEYAKATCDQISTNSVENGGHRIPLIIGVFTHKRMAAKVRMYRKRFGLPYGATFAHNVDWISPRDVSDEDLWRVPRFERVMAARVERFEKRHGARRDADRAAVAV